MILILLLILFMILILFLNKNCIMIRDVNVIYVSQCKRRTRKYILHRWVRRDGYGEISALVTTSSPRLKARA